MAKIARRRRLSSHVVVLAVAALASVAAVGFGATTRNDGLHDTVAVSQRRLLPALEAIHELQGAQRAVAQSYSQLIAGTDASTVQSAELGTMYERISQIWERYSVASLELPGEALLRAELARAFGFDGTPVSNRLEIGADPGNDPVALRARVEALDAFRVEVERNLSATSRLAGLYTTAVEERGALTQSLLDDSSRRTQTTMLVSSLLLITLFVVLGRTSRNREREADGLLERLDLEAARSNYDARLQRGLDMTKDEAGTYRVLTKGLEEATGSPCAEILLADSSRAHLRQVVAVGDSGGPGCGVGSPADCPASQHNQTLVFGSSRDIDACPFLENRPGGACSAVCVPLSVGGRPSGVIHAVGPDGTAADEATVADLELVARKAGERLGVQRAFAKSETQARTDPLTGLLNRRSVEHEAREVTDDGYVVAFGDLDHFKQINDVHGHEAGDRALRLFARVLRDAVRPSDVPARWGGEEFVILLPTCTPEGAAMITERIRERLAEALGRGTVPPFTVSFGVASGCPGVPFSETVAQADAALLRAKAQGRNCTIIAGDDPGPMPARKEPLNLR